VGAVGFCGLYAFLLHGDLGREALDQVGGSLFGFVGFCVDFCVFGSSHFFMHGDLGREGCGPGGCGSIIANVLFLLAALRAVTCVPGLALARV
jgi:hypothetical protein